ncbi:Mannosyl phosphorylinositol ceramide synthase SUR1 [Nakaseomyces bracarensis]|uniref:Mannosyl phosphorylinositol ceramide synthase SUR1 n=1 Tax=Nakaseomyces bracarensis TaxID=273131 RepID=A0ABR4NVG4_9SACH
MGEGVVHGHIHNGDKYTFVHGHVHKADGVCEGFDSDCDDITSKLMLDFDSTRRLSSSVPMDRRRRSLVNGSPSVTPVQCCNPNILEICCDLDHPQNDSLQDGIQFCTSTSTATPNYPHYQNTQHQEPMINNNGHKHSKQDQTHTITNNNNNNNNNVNNNYNNANNNNNSQYSNGFINPVSQDDKDMLIFADHNSLFQDAQFGSATASSSMAMPNEVTNNDDEDLRILQDLCNISQLYEIPLAKHINHHHHNHEHLVNLLETQLPSNTRGTSSISVSDPSVGKVEGGNGVDEISYKTASQIPSIGNTGVNNDSSNQHHHHRIQVHTHDMKDYVSQKRKKRKLMESPMINNKTLLSPQPITSNDREVIGSRAGSASIGNTINFNWNFKEDEDIQCQWDKCDETYTTLFDLQRHMLKDHISNEDKQNIFNGVGHDVSLCQWKDCDFKGDDVCSLVNHINDQHGIHFEINILNDQVKNGSPANGSTSAEQFFNNSNENLSNFHSENSSDANRIENLTMDSDDENSIKKEDNNGTYKSNENGESYVCKWGGCSKHFDTPGSLNEHLETDHLGKGKSRYTCGWDGCNKIFTQRQKLVRHLKVHSKFKPYKCSICQKCFSTEDTLNQHKRIHSGEKPFECHICHKRFTIANSLKIHIRTHTGEKPLTCKICGRSFNESSNLSKHMKTHMKKYFCKECSRSFDTLNKFESHKKRCHSNETS